MRCNHKAFLFTGWHNNNAFDLWVDLSREHDGILATVYNYHRQTLLASYRNAGQFRQRTARLALTVYLEKRGGKS